MARYLTRRKTIRKVKKIKWSPYHDFFLKTSARSQEVYVIETNEYCGYIKLLENSVQSATPVPTVIKAGNFKFTMDASVVNTPMAQTIIKGYIVYIPESLTEGFAASQVAAKLATVPTTHPEWILVQGCLGSETTSQGTGTALINFSSKTFSSRMKRNLQSGDAIYFIAIASCQSNLVIASPELDID